MKEIIIQLIISQALSHGVDPKIAVAVAFVESSLNPRVEGQAGEVGLFQAHPKFYDVDKMKESEELQVHWGIQKLVKSKTECPHRTNYTWVICHNLGIVGGSRIEDAKNQTYYKKIMNVYAALDTDGISWKTLRSIK